VGHGAEPACSLLRRRDASGGVALIAATRALFRREPLLGPSLNRWDEAMALLGVHFLARLLI
jgi:hypothetical protein